MSQKDADLIRQHAPHGWVEAAAMQTNRNVARSATETIMDCPCGKWYGWINRDALQELANMEAGA